MALVKGLAREGKRASGGPRLFATTRCLANRAESAWSLPTSGQKWLKLQEKKQMLHFRRKERLKLKRSSREPSQATEINSTKVQI